MAYKPCDAKQIIVASVGGASDREIHGVVQEEAKNWGYRLVDGYNYFQYNAAKIAIARPSEAKEFRDKILRISGLHGRKKSNLSLLLIGKSAGAIQIWNLFKRHYSELDDFHRIALVLIDPHGAVYFDSKGGAYKDTRNLWWPGVWSTDQDFFRVYNVFQQHTSAPSTSGKWVNLTGASFPDKRVYRNIQITEAGVNHTNIPMHETSRQMIRDALQFTSLSRGEEHIRQFKIGVQDLKGKSTVDAKKQIRFKLENLNCDCYNSDVQVFKDGVLLQTIRNLIEEEETNFRLRTRGRRIVFKATCGEKRAEKTVHLDYDPPTFDRINVSPDTRRKRSIILDAHNVSDDGYWDRGDYEVEVRLDGRKNYTHSGTSLTLNNLSPGSHSATMKIKDGFDHWSSTKSVLFTVSEGPPTLSFISPGKNAMVRRHSKLTITIEAGATGGLMKVEIYLDRVSEDEFNPTRLCYVPGTFGAHDPERKTCTVLADWSRGLHKLIAIATDNSGQNKRVERTFRVH